MNILKSLFLAVALMATAFAQTVQTARNVISLQSATFTSTSAAAYSIGDSVGTVQVLTNIAGASASGRIITLDSIMLKDSANQKKAGYLLFFDGSAPSLTDNTAFAFGSSLPNLIAVLDLAAADYITLDSKGIIARPYVGLRMKLSDTSSNISVAFVTADAPTYGDGGTIKIDFHFSN